MIRFTNNPLRTDLSTLDYLTRQGNELEKSTVQSELRKGLGLLGKIQVPHFLVNKWGTAYTQKYNENPNKPKGAKPVKKQPADVIAAAHSKSTVESQNSSHKTNPTKVVSQVQSQPSVESKSSENKTSIGSTIKAKFRQFKDELAAYSFFGRHSWSKGTPFANWVTQLTKAEDSAVRKYTGSYYRTINGYLRGEIKDSDLDESELSSLKDTIQNIQSALEKSELPENIELHRVMKAESINLFQDSPDNIFQDPAFLSTSPVRGSYKPTAHKGKSLIFLKIHVPKGKGRGAWVAPMSTFKKELEFLMPSSSKFYINRCECIDGKNWEVDLEWTDDEAKEELKKSVNPSMDTEEETSDGIRWDKFTWKASDFRILTPVKPRIKR